MGRVSPDTSQTEAIRLASMIATPISLPTIASNGTSSTPTIFTLLGSFFKTAMAISIPMKLVPMITTSLSLVMSLLMCSASPTLRTVTTFSRSLPSIGNFLGFAPGARIRWSYLYDWPSEVLTLCALVSTLVTVWTNELQSLIAGLRLERCKLVQGMQLTVPV